MGIFSDWAINYYDMGISVLPVEPTSKACKILKWTQKFSHRFPTENEQEKYIKEYSDWYIGLATGKSSGIVAVDFDYQMADWKYIEDLVIGVIPISTVIKKGEKGWTRFYRFDGETQNKSIDRFGERMVDFLSTGRLTVLPPSPHKENGITYHWLTEDTLLDIDVNELEVITKEHVDKIEEIAQLDNSIFKEVLQKDNSRHGKIVGYIIRESEKATDIEELVQNTISFDENINGTDRKGPYFLDENYIKNEKPYNVCKKLVERVCDWKSRKKSEQGINWEIGKYPKLHSQGKKASTNYEDFRTFFEFNYPEARFDKIKNTAFVKTKNTKKWTPIDNIREVIESEASEVGLSPTYVNRHMQKWVSEMKPRLLIDIPNWDGKDRVTHALKCLNIKNLDQDVMIDLFKEWFANIFRRLDSPKNQNKMLILRGEQGIGKDTFLNFMLSGFEMYYSSEVVLTSNQKDNYQLVSELLVGNIPEFDDTHKVSISNLKTLITSPGATFRAPYGRKSDYFPLFHSLVSSSNFNNILRDSSGNRRFMIFELEDIEFNYDHLDSKMLLAQYYHLYKSGYRANKMSYDLLKIQIDNETPKSADDLILEEIKHMMDKRSDTITIRWPNIAEDCERIAKRYRISLRRVQSLMKTNGFTGEDKTSTYYRTPQQ